jgi:hypothetical protein
MRLFFVKRGIPDQCAPCRKSIIGVEKKERIREILLRLYMGETDLPVCKTYLEILNHKNDLKLIDFRAKLICISAERALLRNGPLVNSTKRKPVAAEITEAVAEAFRYAGLPVTRVSKVVEGKKGLQEVGEFARCLEAVFRVLEVDASPAGQVRLLKKRVVKKEPRRFLSLWK